MFLWILVEQVFGGGGGTWTPVRQFAACCSTCLASSIELAHVYPTGRASRASLEKFNGQVPDGLRAILFYMTIAKHWFTGIPEAIASGYIKLLERIYRRWQL